MKIAIISDTHDNIPNLEKALSWINSQGISTLIHCGDLSAPSILDILADKFSGQIHLIYGNVGDRETLEKKVREFPKIKFYGDKGEIKIESKRIAFVHRPDEARELAKNNNYDLIFCGHTHKPWEETIDKTRLVNPGNLAGMFYKASFATYGSETDKLELKILETL